MPIILLSAVAVLLAVSAFMPAQWLAQAIPGSSTVDVGAVAFRPGKVVSTADGVMLEGIERFDPAGDILFTTVSIDSRVSVFDWARAVIDDTTDLRPRESVFGDRSSQEQREYNAALMQESKDTAVVVALEYLGVDAYEATGVGFSGVVEGTAAAGRLTPGELIVAVDGEPVTTVDSLLQLIRARPPGTVITLTLLRQSTGERSRVRLTLSAHPDNDGGFIGLSGVREWVKVSTLDFEIDIASASIGGPSAGLAFTLALIDLLTPGELTGGLPVAVTGRILLDGAVGNVGGVAQKAAAARNAGARLFIVPEDMEHEALSAAGGMPVVGVATLQDALAALGDLGGDVDGLALP